LNEGSSSTFVSYVIKTEVSNPPGTFWESKHRYSEFEALRTLLTRIYKTSCVAPIPEKQTLGDYTKPKAKEDNHMIQKRKRMLQLFLNRIASHPILGRDHVFHQFLEGVLGWNEILSSTGFAYLLKKGSDGGGAGDPQFLAAEDFTFRFNHQVSITHRSEKKIQKIHKEIADTYADLGKRFNIWSLTDSKLSPVIERIGSSFDALAGQNSLLALNLEIKVTEPLQEYTQFAKVVEKLLKVRHKKHAEWETVTESLATKQSNLDKWESSEKEAERISAVLNAEGSSRNDTEQHHIQKPSQGLLATLNSFIDNDPELTRRNNISKAKDAILLLKEKEALVLQELKKYNQEIQFDLDRFQRAKIKDFRNLFLNFCLAQKEFHLKCKNEFKGCKEEIERLKFD
ncbi:Sorting nexin, cytoplasm-to-vacuole targeting pathway/endosomal sorting, partial [Clydaea vesicula]